MLHDDTDAKIIAALPRCDADPVSADLVHHRVDRWCKTSIRKRLVQLERHGLVQSALFKRGGGTIRLWKQSAQVLEAAE